MIKKVVYVMSQNFSGSTILSMLLSKLKGAYFVGEPATLFIKRGKGYRYSWFCTPCKLNNNHTVCPVWGDPEIEYYRTMNTPFFDRLSEKIGNEYDLIIDSSKDLSWIKRNLNTQARAVIVHMSKPVHSWITSMMGRNKRKYPIQFYVMQWIHDNMAIRKFAEQHNLPYLHLGYEQFAVEPEAAIRDLCAFVGRDIEPGKPGARDMHYVRGNPGVNRSLTATGTEVIPERIVLDERWRKALSRKELNDMYSFSRIRRALPLYGYQVPGDMPQTGKGEILSWTVYGPMFRAYRLLYYLKSRLKN